MTEPEPVGYLNGTPVKTLTVPDGYHAFAVLADTIYATPGGEAGGPLHVQLEDLNADLLVGAGGASAMAWLRSAAADIRGERIRRGRWWVDKWPELLAISIAVLELTAEWTEDEACTAVYVWSQARARAAARG